MYIPSLNELRALYYSYRELIPVFSEGARKYGKNNWCSGVPQTKYPPPSSEENEVVQITTSYLVARIYTRRDLAPLQEWKMERARHALIHFCEGVYRGFDTLSIAKVLWFCIVIIFFERTVGPSWLPNMRSYRRVEEDKNAEAAYEHYAKYIENRDEHLRDM